jgi:competence ComEA-like helix-hairpin-helix protein
MPTTRAQTEGDWTGSPARHAAAIVLVLGGVFALASSWSGSRGLPLDAAAARASGGRPASTLNLNTATPVELESLPGIGPALASRIIAQRQKNGPFARIEDLDNVRGIGAATLERIRPYVSVR